MKDGFIKVAVASGKIKVADPVYNKDIIIALARQAAELDTGDCFCAEGRVQSRVYLKVTEGTTQQRTAYEVSVMHMTEREDFPPE